MAQQHQRPNKLPLHVAGKSIADRERKLPCAKGSLSPNPYQWQSKRHKITSPNGCAKIPLIYDAVSAHHLDVLWCQPIKLIQVVSTSEFHEY